MRDARTASSAPSSARSGRSIDAQAGDIEKVGAGDRASSRRRLRDASVMPSYIFVKMRMVDGPPPARQPFQYVVNFVGNDRGGPTPPIGLAPARGFARCDAASPRLPSRRSRACTCSAARPDRGRGRRRRRLDEGGAALRGRPDGAGQRRLVQAAPQRRCVTTSDARRRPCPTAPPRDGYVRPARRAAACGQPMKLLAPLVDLEGSRRYSPAASRPRQVRLARRVQRVRRNERDGPASPAPAAAAERAAPSFEHERAAMPAALTVAPRAAAACS